MKKNFTLMALLLGAICSANAHYTEVFHPYGGYYELEGEYIEDGGYWNIGKVMVEEYELEFSAGSNEELSPRLFLSDDSNFESIYMYTGNTVTITAQTNYDCFSMVDFRFDKDPNAIFNANIGDFKSYKDYSFTWSNNVRVPQATFTYTGENPCCICAIVLEADKLKDPNPFDIFTYKLATVVETGHYLIAYGTWVAKGWCDVYPMDPYGPIEVEALGGTTIRETIDISQYYAYYFQSVEGGFTLKNGYGKYIYSVKDSSWVYASEDMPEEGAIWDVKIKDNQCTFYNSYTGRYLFFDSEYKNFIMSSTPATVLLYRDTRDPYSGIDPMPASDQNAEYYTLDGLRINGELPKGILIRRSGNKTNKLIIR